MHLVFMRVLYVPEIEAEDTQMYRHKQHGDRVSSSRLG